jgi:5-bromo-4-chloroindolyl phosphate hydrolysis protein
MDIFKSVLRFIDKVMMVLGYMVILTWMSQYKMTIITLVIFVGIHIVPWIYDKQKIKKEENVQQGITREEIEKLIKESLSSATSKEDVERVTNDVMDKVN